MRPLDRELIDGTPIVHVHEDIDAANVQLVEKQLATALGPDGPILVVDLSDTRYLDSAGIDMLLRLADRLEHRRSKLILVIPESSQLTRLAAIVGLPEAITIRPSVSGALEAAAPPPVDEHAAPPPSSAGATTGRCPDA